MSVYIDITFVALVTCLDFFEKNRIEYPFLKVEIRYKLSSRTVRQYLLFQESLHEGCN